MKNQDELSVSGSPRTSQTPRQNEKIIKETELNFRAIFDSASEDLLRKSEKFFKEITENSSDITFITDKNGNIKYCSPSIERFSGYKPEEVIGNSGFMFIHPDDVERAVHDFGETILMKDTQPSPNEFRIIHKDGTVRYFAGVGKNLLGDPDIAGVVMNFHDITDSKKTEDALRQSEVRYHILAEHMKDAVWLMDLNLKAIDISPSVEKLLGYTLEEHKQLPLDKLFTSESFKHAMDFFSVELPKALAAPPDYILDRTLELEFVCKNGRTVWGECMFSFIRDDKGDPLSILGEAREINQRKQIEDVLRKSEIKYRNIFENAIEGIYQVTTEGRFITVNKALARMTGYDSPEEFIESIKDIKTQLYVYPEDRDKFLEMIKTKGFVKSFETEFYKKNRSIFWVVINALAVKNEQGEILYNEGLIEDITLRKQAEEKLHQSLEILKKEINTTINVLVAALEVRDPYTAGHQSRSANLACAIAIEMGLPLENIEGLRMAGVIHDIGKLAIPTEILTKPIKLTNLEFSLIKEHSHSGFEMLKDVESIWPLAEIIYQHHERINGTGYPRNLKGDEILMEARILAVADVVEAMASHRPYRAALGIEAALEEIEKNKGILYDDAAADACLRLFREKGYQLKESY